MKLIEHTESVIVVEISESNLRAILADFEDEGYSELTKYDKGVIVRVRVRRDHVHYNYADLAKRGPNWKGAANAR